jgi:hypothetical protein
MTTEKELMILATYKVMLENKLILPYTAQDVRICFFHKYGHFPSALFIKDALSTLDEVGLNG